MQKLIFPIFLFFLGALLQTSTMQKRISSQNLSNRIYKNIDLTLINYIQFDTLSVGLFRPTFCLTNKKGELFILDYSDLTIHAFKFSKDYKKYSHRKFGKGKGKGPGELINPTDFKTYNDTLYIVDPFKGTIEVYYNDFFWKSIKLEKSEIPERIVVSEKHFLIKPQYSKNGIEIIKYDRNGIIQDRFRLSDLIKIDLTTQYYNTDLFQDNSSNLFYILPKATGYLATFDENGINKIKYTIDGPKAQTIKKRKITENFIGNKIVIDYYTISNVWSSPIL